MDRNDIRIRDPFIIREDGNYYLLGTTGNDCWNRGSDFTLYVSRDLQTFEKCGILVNEGTLREYTQIWAPEIHRYKNQYYLLVSVFQKEKGRGSLILQADTLKGPYALLTGEYITPQDWWCLDATLFVKDEKPYLFFSNEWIYPITNDGDGALFVTELSSDLKSIIGRPKKIVSGKYCGFAKELTHNGVKGYVAEGPFVLEEEKDIALYWSTVTPQGYCVVKSKSKEVFGEYLFDRFIFEKDGGHAMIFQGFDQRNYITFHQPNQSPLERMKYFSIE